MKRFLLFLLVLFSPLLTPLAASATAITSISVAGNTVTVNATAHGLSATLPSVFVITGSSVSADNVAGVVVTASANSLTFTASGLSACAASCGTIVAAPRIIVLTTNSDATGINLTFAEWLGTTNGLPAAASSAWIAAGASAGATTAEKNLIGAGGIIEKTFPKSFPLGTSTATIQSILQSQWTADQNALTSSLQPAAFYGQAFDGTSWSQQ